MSIFGKLFGGGPGAKADTAVPVRYEGYAIRAEPAAEGGRYRIGAVIEKDGRTHRMIRADVLEGRDAAVDASISKAKQLIDQQGERLFD